MSETIKTILTADSSELRAEFNKAAAAVSAYQAKQQESFSKARAGYAANLQALSLEAGGFKTLAAGMRSQIALQQDASQLAARLNITEQEAIGLLKQKETVQKQLNAAVAEEAAARARAAAIANPRATGLPGGGELAPLTPQSLQAIERGIASTRELRRQTLLAGQAGKNGSLGFLAFSQAVEDSQFGIRGVLNNIPQMILGFGGTAGLAGALSLAAVAAVVLYPQLKKLYGAADNEIVKKAGEEWDKVFQEGIKAANAFEKNVRIEKDILDATNETTTAIRARLTLGGQMANYYDEELAGARARRDLENEILAARLKLATVSGVNLPGATAAVAGATGQGIDADLINRQKELARLQDEVATNNRVVGNLNAENNAREIADTARLIELKKYLAGSEASLAQIRAAGDLENGATASEFLALSPDRRAAGARKRAIVEEIEALETKGKTVRETTAQEIKTAEDSIKILDEKTNKTYQEIEALKQLKAQREELDKIESATAAATQYEVLQKAIRETSVLARENQKAALEAGQALQEMAKPDAAQTAARADIAAELEALTLRRSGQTAMARALLDEVDLRKEAAALAKATNSSEIQALDLLRQKKQVTEEIRLIAGDLSVRTEDRQQKRDEARQTLIEDARLRNHKGLNERAEQARKNEEEARKKGQDVGKPVDVEKFWNQQINLQTTLVDIFKKLGVA